MLSYIRDRSLFAAQKIDARTGAASGPLSLPLRRPLELTARSPAAAGRIR